MAEPDPLLSDPSLADPAAVAPGGHGIGATAAPLWHGRFAEGPAEELWEYTLSLPFDQRLAPYDIAGCRAHARGLADADILTDDDVAAVIAALDTVGAELAGGLLEFAPMGVLLADADGVVLYANQEATAMAAIPSLRPIKPIISLVVALMPTA